MSDQLTEIVEQTWNRFAAHTGYENFKLEVHRACEEWGEIQYALGCERTAELDEKLTKQELINAEATIEELRGELKTIKEVFHEDYGFKFDGNIADATLHFVHKLYVENEQITELRRQIATLTAKDKRIIQ